MSEVVLQASRRTVVGKQVKALRRAGKLPGVIYGRKIQPILIALDLKEASRILQGLPASALVVVQVDAAIELPGEEHYTLVREKQRDPLARTFRHVDFQAVSLTEKVRVDVAIFLSGESPAVKNFGAVLVTGLEKIEVEALPRDLPGRITVDVSKLVNIGDAIHIRDLRLPAEVEIFAEPDEMVVVVTAPLAEEEEAAAAEAAEPELVERKKKEEVEE